MIVSFFSVFSFYGRNSDLDDFRSLFSTNDSTEERNVKM